METQIFPSHISPIATQPPSPKTSSFNPGGTTTGTTSATWSKKEHGWKIPEVNEHLSIYTYICICISILYIYMYFYIIYIYIILFRYITYQLSYMIYQISYIKYYIIQILYILHSLLFILYSILNILYIRILYCIL